METFQIAPANVRAIWIIVTIMAIPVVILTIVLLAVMSGMKARFEVSSMGLRLAGDFYGRTIAANDLRGGSARRIDIGTGDLQPVRRTLGTGLPGYRSGWFRLRNGQKALLYVTDPRKAVYLPTSLDFVVIVTPDDPEQFLSAVRQIAPAS
jgi:hypothetical protein